ncbi:hypothetical protein BDF20DRAFT_917212 [Mycotypha africana]|uniref:uncharacterized protein n=1 Tax=Mycotypha africana TaxID=64632 RepID=UPI002301D94B|nr:uncharacterized protein BDF20DRAFT_917212 [Mycotypha africana]KAI8967975.1 hypothetical protein BDF20DRAFT_917212 [Mycotypha africana]
MSKPLQQFYEKWNTVQQRYYTSVLEALAINDITTYSTLKQKSLEDLHTITNVPRPIMHAFVKQIQYDLLKHENEVDNIGSSSQSLTGNFSEIMSTNDATPRVQYLSTGFERLDELLSQGLQFGQFVEICGEATANKFKFVSHVLLSFSSSYNTDNLHLFDVTGMLEPRRLSNPFINDKDKFNMLAHIKCHQVFNLHNLLQSLENLAALLLSKSGNANSGWLENEHVLIVIDDLSKIIDQQQQATDHLIRIFQTLCGKLNCCIVNIHHISMEASKPQKQHKAYSLWDSTVDLKLHVEEANDGQPRSISVGVLKSRDPVSFETS